MLNSTLWLKRQKMKLVAEKVSRWALNCFYTREIHKYKNTQIHEYTGVEERAVQRCASAQWEVHRRAVHTQDLPSRQQGIHVALSGALKVLMRH